jgi:DNA modification methylase
MKRLKPTGLLWLNMGDAYNTPVNWRLVDHRYSSLGPNGDGLDETNAAYTKRRAKRRAFIDKEAGWLRYGNLLALPYRIVLELSERGHLFRGEIIWEKSRPMPEGRCRRPHRRHESIYVFARDEGHAFRVTPPVGSVWKLLQTPNRTPHCSSFPLDLPRQAIEASGLETRGLVLDPFMGSGTTARAARMLGHDFIGFEVDHGMCDVANREAGISAASASGAPGGTSQAGRDGPGRSAGRRSPDQSSSARRWARYGG